MAPKPKPRKSPDPQFLFVNEDASTVTRTTKDTELDRTKQSHVQRQNVARRRRLQEQTPTAAPSSSHSSVSPGPATTRPFTTLSPESREPPHDTDYFDIVQSVDVGDPFLQLPSPLSQSQDLLYPQFPGLFPDHFRSSVPSPTMPSRQGSFHDTTQFYQPAQGFDAAFPSYSVTTPPEVASNMETPSIPISRSFSRLANDPHFLDKWAPPLIQYYNTIVLPEIFWKDTRNSTLGQTRHASSIHADMRACMAEPGHLYAFLALAATQMLARAGRFLIPEASQEDHQMVPAFFKTKAIQALMAKLGSGQLDQRATIDVHRLYATGIYAGDDEMVGLYFHTLVSTMEPLGGLNAFNDYELEKMIILDCLAALQALVAPRLLATWDPGPLADDVLVTMETNHDHLAEAGSRVETTLAAFHDGRILFQSFCDLVQTMKMSTHLEKAAQYVPEYYKWFNRRLLGVLHRLLSMPLHCQLDGKADSVRIALSFCAALTRSPAMARRAVVKSNHSLRMRLESTDLRRDFWRPTTDLLLWVIVCGGISTSNKDDLNWYVQAARDAAMEVGVTSFLELEQLLAGFLYDPYSQRDFVVHFAALMWPMLTQ